MITPETFFTSLVVGSVVRVIKEYGVSVGEYVDDLSKHKSSLYSTRSKVGGIK